MAEERTPNPVARPPFDQWAPGYPPPPPKRSRFWPAIALGAFVIAMAATIVAVVALVVATNRPSASGSTPTTSSPTYSAAEVSAAHQKLCDAYKLAARAVQIETHGPSPERAGIAEVNGAMMLKRVINAAPELTASDHTTALALADAYNDVAAVASLNDNSRWQAALDDANAKDTAMKKLCGGE
ncbi:hypothetical protein MTIM_44140 [Mycobacterium timonense]|uniref:Alanine and proline rich membrane protein n=1 Tax=Mycobacterium timonense TaxID=701043 RepID=A0A7I9ZCF9_9MYCO|nr:hypothetical protein MTIM_44140 [Mycobacterium timonense]